MVAFACGQADAFALLFERYNQPLFGFFARRVAEPAVAEELAQETFLALLRAASRYQPTALFRTYIYAVAFKILSAHRRKVAFRSLFLGKPDAENQPDAGPSEHSSVLANLLVRQAIARLDNLDREVLLLREFEQLSYTEIAEVLRLPLNTVRSRIFRARSALQEILSAPAHTTFAAPQMGFEEQV